MTAPHALSMSAMDLALTYGKPGGGVGAGVGEAAAAAARRSGLDSAAEADVVQPSQPRGASGPAYREP